MEQKTIPQDKTLEGTIPLLISDGYEFIKKRCDRYNTDIFETRLLLNKTICMSGEDAGKIFYDSDRFQRKGAVPGRINKTLFGQGGVQGMDGEAHHHRKGMFMSLMSTENIAYLLDLIAAEWPLFLRRWAGQDEIVLYDEMQELLCRAVCAWTGINVDDETAKERGRDFGAMVDAIGAVGPRHWRGRWARNRTEDWMMDLITQIREGKLDARPDSAAHVFALERDYQGGLLDNHTAAVEWMNILRPTVAISRFITFAALGLYEHPENRSKLQSDDDFIEMFVQEIRRYYPFTPFLGALVKEEFDWRGYQFPAGRLVLLDVYGILRDERIWDDPEQFEPERFRDWEGNPYNLIPQGGGDYYTGHRCAGEWITIEVMKQAVEFLAREMTYDVPPQDLHVSLTRIPAMPESRFVMSNVERIRETTH